MLFIGCKLKPSDNSGIKKVKCIRIIKKTKKYAQVGDLVGIVIQKFKKHKKLLKKTMYFGLVLCTKAYVFRLDGIRINASSNRLILMSNKNQVLSTRLFGPIFKEIRNMFIGKGRHRRWRYDKVVSLANKVI